MIARRQYRKLKLRVEAARLKEEEERALRKQMDKRKAQEIAEMKYRVSLPSLIITVYYIMEMNS